MKYINKKVDIFRQVRYITSFFSKYKRIFIIILLFPIIAYFLLRQSYFTSFRKLQETFTNDSNPLDIMLVVSRYNESLEWLNDAPFNKYPVIIYNKGSNENFIKPGKLVDIINLPNVGRESHTYLCHILQNYEDDKINNITVFLPGSVDVETKRQTATTLLNLVEEKKSAIFLATPKTTISSIIDFSLNEYSSANVVTKNDNKWENSEIRPYGNWIKKIIPDDENIVLNLPICLWGIFSVGKNDIMQHMKQRYQNIIHEVDHASNPETGHYLERSWAAVFNPLNNTMVINNNLMK